VPGNDQLERLAAALGVEAAHFREYRIRVILGGQRRVSEVRACTDTQRKQNGRRRKGSVSRHASDAP